MLKPFAYITLMLIFAACLSFADNVKSNGHAVTFLTHNAYNVTDGLFIDTIAKKPKQQDDDKKKVKEIGKAKHQAKPEKVEEPAPAKTKPKRERRPEGMERPPEIPRRNGP